mmetsp:Transcript_42886/g.91550  ORF Transcript_42886/g.91550 Transcript_42886/m.91550 type:complete len:306 (-) Transcript_42886:677-1594(-)
MPLRFLFLLTPTTLLVVLVLAPPVPVSLFLLALLPLVTLSLGNLRGLDGGDEVVVGGALLVGGHCLGGGLALHHRRHLLPRGDGGEQGTHQPTQRVLVSVHGGAPVPLDAPLLLRLVPRELVLQLLEECEQRRLGNAFEGARVGGTESLVEVVELGLEGDGEGAVQRGHEGFERLAVRLVLLVELLDVVLVELGRGRAALQQRSLVLLGGDEQLGDVAPMRAHVEGSLRVLGGEESPEGVAPLALLPPLHVPHALPLLLLLRLERARQLLIHRQPVDLLERLGLGLVIKLHLHLAPLRAHCDAVA